MNCKTRGYKYKTARKEGAPRSTVSALINLRSELTHIEFQFSPRYWCVSVSATMADGAKCVRFKRNRYSHPNWWSTRTVPATDEQEDRMFREALWMADVTEGQFYAWWADKCPGILHGPNAIKYDLAGCSFSFIIKQWRIWVPDSTKQWCSEFVKNLISSAFRWFGYRGKRADESTPSDVDWLVEHSFYQIEDEFFREVGND